MQGGRGAGAKGQILALKPRRGRESDPDSDPHSPFNVYPHGKQSSYTTRQLGRIQRDGETEIRQKDKIKKGFLYKYVKKKLLKETLLFLNLNSKLC